MRILLMNARWSTLTLIEVMLLTFLVVSAIAVCATRHLLASVIIFTSYSVVMSILWILLASPDLGITEAAVGAGISSILLFVALKRIRVMEEHVDEDVPGELDDESLLEEPGAEDGEETDHMKL